MCGTQFQQENLFVKSDLTCQKPVERNFYKGKGLPVCCHSCGIFLKGEALAAYQKIAGNYSCVQALCGAEECGKALFGKERAEAKRKSMIPKKRKAKDAMKRVVKKHKARRKPSPKKRVRGLRRFSKSITSMLHVPQQLLENSVERLIQTVSISMYHNEHWDLKAIRERKAKKRSIKISKRCC